MPHGFIGPPAAPSGGGSLLGAGGAGGLSSFSTIMGVAGAASSAIGAFYAVESQRYRLRSEASSLEFEGSIADLNASNAERDAAAGE